MNGKTIEIEVDKQGKTKVTFRGFQGNLCFDEAERIYASLRKSGVDLEIEKIEQNIGDITQRLPIPNPKNLEMR